MNQDVVGELVQSISSSVALSASNNKATGQEIMRALAIVVLTVKQMSAEDVRDSATSGLLDSVAMEMQEPA